jgi:hypothetical protein
MKCRALLDKSRTNGARGSLMISVEVTRTIEEKDGEMLTVRGKRAIMSYCLAKAGQFKR